MYTYNKNDKSYTFSSDELDIDKIVNTVQLDTDEKLVNEDDSNLNSDSEAKNSSESDTNSNGTDNSIVIEDTSNNSEQTVHEKPRKIEVINGGNDLDISPVTNYIEVEKPRNEKKENIVIPKNNKWHFGACHKSAIWHF